MDPSAVVGFRAGRMKSVPAKPDYLQCWKLYKTLLMTSDKSLLAQQHKKCYPRYSHDSLSLKKKQGMTLDEYIQIWETYDTTTQMGAFKNVWTETGKHGWVHTWFEHLPDQIREHVLAMPGAFPEKEADWTVEFLCRTTVVPRTFGV